MPQHLRGPARQQREHRPNQGQCRPDPELPGSGVGSPKYANGLVAPVCAQESHSDPAITTPRASAILRMATGHARSARPRSAHEGGGAGAATRRRTAPRPTATSSGARGCGRSPPCTPSSRQRSASSPRERRRRDVGAHGVVGRRRPPRGHGHRRRDQHQGRQRQQPPDPPRVETRQGHGAGLLELATSSPVMRKPEITKKTSTPTKPPRAAPTPAWKVTTSPTATARSPSMSARNRPRRRRRVRAGATYGRGGASMTYGGNYGRWSHDVVNWVRGPGGLR